MLPLIGQIVLVRGKEWEVVDKKDVSFYGDEALDEAKSRGIAGLITLYDDAWGHAIARVYTDGKMELV